MFTKEIIITYLLIPWSWVLLEKLIGSQLVKKFPIFYGTRRFITAFTCHLSLSWARSIQSKPTYRTSWRSILILFYYLRLGLPSGLFPWSFSIKTLYINLSYLRTCQMPRPSHQVSHQYKTTGKITVLYFLTFCGPCMMI